MATDNVVPDSGEESEDEWNYINTKKETEESHAIAQNIAESQEACSDVSFFKFTVDILIFSSFYFSKFCRLTVYLFRQKLTRIYFFSILKINSY